MIATATGPNQAELRVPGSAPVLHCEFSGVTGEWTPVGISIDGDYKPLESLNLPPVFTLNGEALDALEVLA